MIELLHCRCEKVAIRLLFVLVVIGNSAQPALARRPVPPAEAQEAVERAIRKTYGDDYAKAKSHPEKVTLAAQLRRMAEDSQEAPFRQYVLLRQASKVAAEAGEADQALAAVDLLDKIFAIDCLALKLDCLQAAAKAAGSTAQLEKVASEAKALLEKAIAVDRYDAAGQAADVGLSAGRAAKNRMLVKELVTRKKEIEEAAAAIAKIKPALAVLEEKPLDPQANAEVGRFFCFVKEDWQRGITLLALGADESLKALAWKEMGAESGKPKAESGGSAAANALAPHANPLNVADGWWEVAKAGQNEAVRLPLLKHAGVWYRQALPGLKAAEKERVEQRLREVESLGESNVASTGGPGTTPKKESEAEALAAAAKLRAKMKAAKKPLNFVFNSEAAVKQAWRLPPQPSEWQITAMGLQLTGRDTRSIQSLFTFAGDCEVSLTVASRYHDPPAIQLFGEEIPLPQPRRYTGGAKPYVWNVIVARRGANLSAAIGGQQIAAITIKEAQQNSPTHVGINYSKNGYGMLLMAVSLRAAEYNAPP